MIRVRTEVNAEDANFTTAGLTLATAAFNVVQGEALVVAVTSDSSTANTLSVSDNRGNTYVNITPPGLVNDTTNGQQLQLFAALNCPGGSTTVTAAYSASVVAKGVHVFVVAEAGLINAIDGGAGQVQQTPTTTTDAVTSGAATVVRGPALLIGLSEHNAVTNTPPAAGTGFTTGNTFWAWGTTVSTRAEFRRVTAAGSYAATFTAVLNTAHTTMVVAIDEAPAAIPGGQIFFVTGPGSRMGKGPRRGISQWEPTLFTPPAVLAPFLTEEYTSPGAKPTRQRNTDDQLPYPRATPVPPFQDPSAPLPASRIIQRAPADPLVLKPVQAPLVLPPALQPDTYGIPKQIPRRAELVVPFEFPQTSGARAPWYDDQPKRILPPPAQRTPEVGWALTKIDVVPVYQKSADDHYVVKNGVPFPIKGRTAWAVLAGSVTEYTQFLTDVVAKKFSAIELGLIWHDPRTTRAPFANNSALLPFTTKVGGGAYTGVLTDTPDFTTPDSSYWSFVDTFLNACDALGLLCFVFPAYHGFQTTSQGWQAEIVANGTTRMQTYGAFVANRYRNQQNLVWMMGGDAGSGSHPFTAPQLAGHQALLDGMKSVSGQRSVLLSAEWDSPSIFADGKAQFTFTGGQVTYQFLQGCYDFDGDLATQGRAGYSAGDGPAFELEGPFDEEGSAGTNANPASTEPPPVRRYQWWGWLSAIGGYNTGNGYVWPFNATGTLPATDDWRNHLSTTGAQNMAVLNGFIDAHQWWKLVPSGLSGMRTLVVANGGTVGGTTYVSAAQAADGSFLVAYRPPQHTTTFSVDLRSMQAGPITGHWFDPTTGAYQSTGTTYTNAASAQVFTVPGNNAAGDADWVLFLQGVGFADPYWAAAPLPSRWPRAPRNVDTGPLNALAATATILALPDQVPWPRAARAGRAPVEAWFAGPLTALGSLAGDDSPRQPPEVYRRSPPDSWLGAPPPSFFWPDPYTPRPAAGAARADAAPWVLTPLAQLSTALPDPYPIPHRVIRGVPDLTPWGLQALGAISAALDDGLPPRSWRARAAQDLAPWAIPSLLNPVALMDDQPGPRRAAAPARAPDVWALAPLFSPYALQDASPVARQLALSRAQIEAWTLPALATGVAALPDPTPAPRRPWAPRPQAATWELPALFYPYALPDPAPTRPAPARAPGVSPPWEMSPLAPYTPWHQADPTPSARFRAVAYSEPWFMTTMGPPTTPNPWNSLPPPPRWVNRPARDLSGWGLPPLQTPGAWYPWDPQVGPPRAPAAGRAPLLELVLPALATASAPQDIPAARARAAAVRAAVADFFLSLPLGGALSDPAPRAGAAPPPPRQPTIWDLPPFLRVALADLVARAPAAPPPPRTAAIWDLPPFLRAALVDEYLARRARATAPLVVPPWDLARLGSTFFQADVSRSAPLGRRVPPAAGDILWTIIPPPVLGRFFHLDPPYRQPWVRYQFERSFEGGPLGQIIIPPLPQTAVVPPFVVQLVGVDGVPDLNGKTVLVRAQPADRRRTPIMRPAEVVDATNAIVRVTWTADDFRHLPTDQVIVQFIVIDGVGRARTYPGGGRYYHVQIIGRPW